MKEMSLPELQKASLDICKDIHKFCEENGIRYYLGYGSLLGAVRHGGFIPWDDDMDIMMLRPDYEKFMASYVSDRYKAVDSSVIDDCYIAFGRVCDMTDTVVSELVPWHGPSVQTGIWVDIFPLDAAPEDDSTFQSRYSLLNHLYSYGIGLRKARAMVDDKFGLKGEIKAWFQSSMHPRLRSTSPEEFARHIIYLSRLEPYTGSGRVAQMCCADSPESVFDIELFGDGELVPFDGVMLRVPSHKEEILRIVYGDYMRLPDQADRKPQQRRHFKFFWK